jgi:hypothetical protein
MFSYGSVLRNKGVRREGPDRYEQVGFYYSQSNIGGCDRELYLQAKGAYEFDPGNVLLGIFQDGETHEELTGRQLRSAGIEVIEAQSGSFLELPSHPLIESSDNIAGVAFDVCPVCDARIIGPCLHGHIDFITRNPLTGAPEIVEHKAINSNWWDSTVKAIEEGGGKEFFSRHKRYAIQLGLYLVDLARRYRMDASEGALVFKNKDRARFLDVRMRYDVTSDTIHIISADIEGKFIMAGETGHEIPNFFKHTVNKILRIEQALREPKARHMLRSGGSKCATCDAKECCSAEFDVDVSPDDEKVYLVDEGLAGQMAEFQSIQARLSALEKEKKELSLAFESVLSRVAEAEGRFPVILNPADGSCLTFQGWSRTNIDWDSVKELGDEERAVLDKVLKRTSGKYPRIKPLTKKLEKKLGEAVPVGEVLPTADFSEGPGRKAVRRRLEVVR